MESPENHQVSLRVEPGQWSWAVEAHLAGAVTPYALIGIKGQVERGAAALFCLWLGDACVGAYVLRVDKVGPLNEGVIVAAGGSVKGVDLVDAILPHAETQFVGVDAIRVHTARAGLLRKLERHGYTVPEIIMRKQLHAAPL